MSDICIRCKKREPMINPKTGLPAKLCAHCFVRAIDKLFLEVQLEDERMENPDNIQAYKTIWPVVK